jgi:Family of unknown function (DUF5677)
MKTIPIDNFIPRVPDPKIQSLLSQYSEFLEEIVNYGSHIMSWKPNDYNKGEQGLPIVLFLRNYLSYIDSCSILVKCSSIEPCHSLLRTSFENLLYILYLIDDSSGKKALGYIIWNAFEKSKLLTRHDGKSKQYLDLVDCYKKTELLNDVQPPIFKNIDKRKETNKRLINARQFADIVKEYHRTSGKFKGKPFAWYNLFDGPSDIRKLAEKVKLESFYIMLYKNWSSSTHGTSVIDGVVTGDENGIAQINQIRLPFDAESVTGTGIYLSAFLFSKYIKAKMPERDGEFKLWYKQFSQDTKIVLDRTIFLSK